MEAKGTQAAPGLDSKKAVKGLKRQGLPLRYRNIGGQKKTARQGGGP
jgi:hypothetical protein